MRNLLQGQYDRPVRVLALNGEEGWVRDGSEIITAKVQEVAKREEQGLTAGTRTFVEAHSEATGRATNAALVAVKLQRPGGLHCCSDFPAAHAG